MGGGGPVRVDGGMDEEAYRRLQMEERTFMAEQEERQMQLMNEMEDARMQREQAEINRQERVRENEESALERMESALSDNVTAITTDLKDEDKDIVLDFYGSLGQAGSERPQ